jgi:hypothetical protein
LKPKNTYNKPCFETAYLGEKLINLFKLKVAQKVANVLGYFIFSKNHNEPPKVAQLAKIAQSGHPANKLVFRYTKVERPAKNKRSSLMQVGFSMKLTHLSPVQY